ncbi:MAG TPA: DUF4446 family protein [Candidatus Doudnabacteria bacterium]|nr:DUF4446 family protein [Candidatus Doudnabacteria bacterium]
MNGLNLEIISLALALLALILGVISITQSNKVRRFRQLFHEDEQPDNLEEIISSISEMLKKLKSDHADLTTIVESQGTTLQTAFQFSSVIRFDSGGSDGGNLSFAVALLDGHQTGLIITSLHGREHNRIYCKPIKEGVSTSQLSEEEQEALIEALTKTGTDKTKPEKQIKQKENNN